MKKRALAVWAGVAALLLAALLTTLGALGYFSKQYGRDITVDYDAFRVETRIYFAGGGDAVPDASGAVAVDYLDPAAANYLGKLRVDVTYTGKGQAMLRAAVLELWTGADGESLRMPYTEFAAATTAGGAYFLDARRSGSYLYYQDPATQGLQRFVVKNGSAEGVTFPLVTGLADGFSWSAQPEGTQLKLRVIVSAVQKNRYEQLWAVTEAQLLALIS